MSGWVPEPDRKPRPQKRGVNPAIASGPPPVQLRITPAGKWRPNAPEWPNSPNVPQMKEVHGDSDEAGTAGA